MDLRPYQCEAIEGVKRLFASGRRRIVLGAPTGAGKTRIAAEIATGAAAKGREVWFIADRIVLCEQTSASFSALGISHDYIQAGNTRASGHPVKIASAQTLESRLAKGEWNPATLVIWDECHVQRTDLLDRMVLADAYMVGLSATPCAAGMGRHWQGIHSITTQSLFDQGFLIRPTFESADPGKADLAEFPVRTWLERFGDQRPLPPTVAYCNRIGEANLLATEFCVKGVPAAAIHGGTLDQVRRQAIKDFNSGALTVLTSCDVLIAGFDAPHTSCLIVAKKVKGLIRAMQIVGRCMRPAAGKTSAVVLDHAGMMQNTGLELECHWRIGFNSLALDILRTKRMQRKLQKIAVRTKDLTYVDRDLLPADYRPEIELWANVCRYVADRLNIEWRPDAKDWHEFPQGHVRNRAYWQCVHNYRELTGVKLSAIRKVPFFASESCPPAISAAIEQRIKQYQARKDAERERKDKRTLPLYDPLE